jgi:hypothetical protein
MPNIVVAMDVMQRRSSDTVLAEISTLVAERQRLRTRGASTPLLERNRVMIARAQWELSYALIRHFRPDAERQAA